MLGRPPGPYGVVEDAGSEVVVPDAPEGAGLDIGALGAAGAAGAGFTLMGVLMGAVAAEGAWLVIGAG